MARKRRFRSTREKRAPGEYRKLPSRPPKVQPVWRCLYCKARSDQHVPKACPSGRPHSSC